MKKYKYEIIFLNDKVLNGSYPSLLSAVICAMAWADVRGLDNRIKYITDEEGNVYTDIELHFDFKKFSESEWMTLLSKTNDNT